MEAEFEAFKSELKILHQLKAPARERETGWVPGGGPSVSVIFRDPSQQMGPSATLGQGLLSKEPAFQWSFAPKRRVEHCRPQCKCPTNSWNTKLEAREHWETSLSDFG